MPTQPPSPPSPLDPNDAATVKRLVDQIHEDLASKFGVDVKRLVVVSTYPGESLLGEDARDPWPEHFSPTEFLSLHTSIGLRNPTRIHRQTVINRASGQQTTQLLFSDYDFIHRGTIEVRPVTIFYLTWLDYMSQGAYCSQYLSFLEGRARAYSAARSGIVTPDSAPPGLVAGIMNRKG